MNDYNVNDENQNVSENNETIIDQNVSIGENENDNTDSKVEEYKTEKNTNNATKKSGIPKGLLNEDFINTIEINIIKLTKISNKLSEEDSKKFAEEIKFLKEIEKDYAKIFNIKLTKSQKDLLIKYVK